MQKGRLRGGLFLAALCMVLATPAGAGENRVDQKQAIEIARAQVNFEPASIETATGCENGHKTWVVTLRSTPDPNPMGRMMIVTIDRSTGQVLSLARN